MLNLSWNVLSMYCKWKAERSNGCRMVLSVSVIRVIVWLAGNEGSLLLPSITNILDHISIAQEKIKIQTLKFGLYRILPAFALPWSKKIITQSIVNQVSSLVTSWISKDDFPCFLLKKKKYSSALKKTELSRHEKHTETPNIYY